MTSDTIGCMIRRGLDLANKGRWTEAAMELSPLKDFRDLTIDDLERAFPLAHPCPKLTSKPSGPRLHPRHLHDTNSYGPSCFDNGCPRWCWVGHPLSYGDDTPDVEALT